MSWNKVYEFESMVSDFFGAKYGVSVDSCTHGVELCLRYLNVDKIVVPKRTYLSIPFLAKKLNLSLEWKDENWKDFYQIGDSRVYDAAVLWKENSYIPNTFMCLSFQFQKHLNIGKGGMILLDNEKDRDELRKMVYDGREPDIPWREQNITTIGYHYYMNPELAEMGIKRFNEVAYTEPRDWVLEDWPDLTKMEIFK